MKKLLVILCAAFVFVACEKQEQRYFADSAEIETLKAGINAYETGDWEKWRSHFADTAKIYVNSTKSVSPEDRGKELQEAVSNFSSYGFNHDKEYIEMVLDKEDETWVYYWATWNGEMAANQNKLSIPVHLAVQFVDGKIMEEHVYFDGTAMYVAFSELEAAQKAAEEAAAEEEGSEESNE